MGIRAAGPAGMHPVQLTVFGVPGGHPPESSLRASRQLKEMDGGVLHSFLLQKLSMMVDYKPGTTRLASSGAAPAHPPGVASEPSDD